MHREYVPDRVLCNQVDHPVKLLTVGIAVAQTAVRWDGSPTTESPGLTG